MRKANLLSHHVIYLTNHIKKVVKLGVTHLTTALLSNGSSSQNYGWMLKTIYVKISIKSFNQFSTKTDMQYSLLIGHQNKNRLKSKIGFGMLRVLGLFNKFVLVFGGSKHLLVIQILLKMY